jgi:hypothetical protein
MGFLITNQSKGKSFFIRGGIGNELFVFEGRKGIWCILIIIIFFYM